MLQEVNLNFIDWLIAPSVFLSAFAQFPDLSTYPMDVQSPDW